MPPWQGARAEADRYEREDDREAPVDEHLDTEHAPEP